MRNGVPFGIDVSNNNGFIDWSATPDDIDFVFMKASEGNYYTDTHVDRNADGVRKRGYKVGFYHFLQPSLVGDAQKEAYYFMDVINNLDLQVGEMLVCDIEQGVGNLHDYNLFFMQLVEMIAGFKPIEYSRKNFIEEHGLNTTDIAQHALWVAQYPSSGQPTIYPPVPSAWETFSFWQYSEKGRITGTNSNVDFNIFNGALDRIPLLGKPSTTTPPIENKFPIETLNNIYSKIDKLQNDLTDIKTDVITLQEWYNKNDG